MNKSATESATNENNPPHGTTHDLRNQNGRFDGVDKIFADRLKLSQPEAADMQ